jgi:outer membrane biogenesis lipoprotein LolB
MFSALRRLVLCGVTALLVGACLAPTLPLPPPDHPTVEGPDENGETHLSGRVQTGAAVYALNRSTDSGTFQFTDQTGNYRLTLTTQVGDEILMWYSLGQQQSDQLEFEIRAP